MDAPRLRVLLVEDDELFRLGLRMKLQQEADVATVVEAGDGETALNLVEQHGFDIVLLDIGLPRIGGVEVCRQLQQKHPQLPILVLTSRTDAALINQLIEVGVRGYFLKGGAPEALVLALRSVIAGASWWDHTATLEIQNIAQSKKAPELLLTPREKQILQLITAGKTTQEIAEAFYITPGTVRVHIHAILQKLDVRDRTQAALLALQKGLITSSANP